MADTKHTPTPWQIHEIETRDGNNQKYMSYAVADARDRVIMDATNSSVAEIRWEPDGEPADVQHFDVQSEADAAFIVRACNAHGTLVSAARKVLDHLNARIDQAPGDAVPLFVGIAELAAALAKAEGP